MQQIRALRAQAFWERITNHHDPGAFPEMGNTCAQVLSQSERRDETARLSAQCQSPTEAALAANMPTTIRRLSAADFERLFRHGQVADYTLYAYHAEQFKFIGYGNSPRGNRISDLVFGNSRVRA